MGQSFYTSIGGIKAAQTQLNVVSDNLANMNTLAYKQSSVNFSDIYYSTLSTGSGGTDTSGGTNAIQIGLGTQVSSITRDFTTGNTNTTGVETDMMIQGNGFFTVKNSTGEILYTKAGKFTLDDEGYLVMPNGNKVLGTAETFSSQASSTPIKVPPLIQTETVANNDTTIANKTISQLNGIKATEGTFSIDVSTDGGVTSSAVSITIDQDDTMADLVSQIQTKLDAAAGTGHFTVAINNGKLTVTSATPATDTLDFNKGTSDFPAVTGLTSNTGGSPYSSKTLDWQQNISSSSTSSVISYSSMEVTDTGVIEVTYSNGDKITVTQNDQKETVFKYTTADGVTITGNDCNVDPSFLVPSNLQIQLASFINPNGLVAEGGNCYSVGSNAGDAFYGTGNGNGFGSVESGQLETSNVDMTEQFADMIIAQRAITANSRVFSTQNDVMDTINTLGR